MARTRSAKSDDDMLVKSAEFVGWALGGLEREITKTRERLASLNAQAVKLRARIGKAIPAVAAADHGEKASRKQRRRQMSREARERISSAMKKRWAERKKARS